MVNGILKEVDKLIKKYTTRNPFEIAKALNIEVVYHDLGNLKGYYYYQSRMKYIVINKNIADELKPIICAHELGHYRLHLDFAKNAAIKEFSLFDMTSKPKREANLFAAELLIDDDQFIELTVYGYTCSYIASELNVPVEIVDFKGQLMKLKGFEINAVCKARGDFLRG